MGLIETHEWLRSMEAEAFSLPKSRVSLPQADVERFFSKSTALDTIMPSNNGPYTRKLVDTIYDFNTWDEFRLKRYVTTDYPAAILEAMFQSEHKDRFLEILTGIYPFRIINAGAIRSPFGNDVILISEWLFSFLWDFYHEHTAMLMKASSYGLDNDELINIERRFASQLRQGNYYDWQLSKVLDSDPIENISRYFILMALIFIIGHEIGHIFLGHTSSGKCVTSFTPLSTGKVPDLSVYSYPHVMEFEADLFSSDLYFIYLYNGFDKIDPDFFHFAHIRGFNFLKILARAQEGLEMDYFKYKSHPPGALRYAYILLRHRDKLEKQGFNISGIAEVIESHPEEIPDLDYMKDLGVHSIFK